LGTGYARKNPYLIFLSAAAFFLLVVCIVLGLIQAGKLRRADTVWDSRESLYAGRAGTAERFEVRGFRSWFFFRIHAVLTGRLETGKGAFFRVFRHGSFTGDEPTEVPLHFPLSGTYHGEACFSVRDVFGLTRSYAFSLYRELPVQPSLLEEDALVRIDSSGGEDDKQKKKSSDEDKYYMREYIPGDRIRDINWKATSRVGELFTRISPVTEEETKYIFIELRHYKEGPDTLRSQAHLEALKRWLLSFLWQLKQTMPEYRCGIKSSRGKFAVETENDIRHLSLLLSGINFEADPGDPPAPERGGDIYIFTTALDRRITTAVSAYTGRTVTVMQTVDPPVIRGGSKNGAASGRVLEIPMLGRDGMLHYPGGWIARSGLRGTGPGGRSVPAAIQGVVRRETKPVKGRLL
jgi:uncharacterized protein (DUF58 family)